MVTASVLAATGMLRFTRAESFGSTVYLQQVPFFFFLIIKTLLFCHRFSLRKYSSLWFLSPVGQMVQLYFWEGFLNHETSGGPYTYHPVCSKQCLRSQETVMKSVIRPTEGEKSYLKQIWHQNWTEVEFSILSIWKIRLWPCHTAAELAMEPAMTLPFRLVKLSFWISSQQ